MISFSKETIHELLDGFTGLATMSKHFSSLKKITEKLMSDLICKSDYLEYVDTDGSQI